MKTIKTNLSIEHLELIKIFFEASKLPNVIIGEYNKILKDVSHKMIDIMYDDEDVETAGQITYMSLVHAGLQNMLDDYLMKCGVSVWDLQPKTIREQELKEKEEERAEALEQHLQKIDKQLKER